VPAAHSAVAVRAVPVTESIVTRRLGSRRPLSFLSWLLLGGAGTYVDKIHEHFGVVAYPNHDWVGERLPVSPAYLMATLGFFILYTAVVGHRGRNQGIFGGPPLRAVDLGYALSCWVAAYVVSGWFGAARSGALPFIGALFLAAWAAPTLWRARRTQLPVFALLVVAMGVGFEWTATLQGAFAYPVCPSTACAGTTVPIVWLSWLYVHAAIFVHRMLGGRHLLSRKFRTAPGELVTLC
jgi:hypothetical protein